MADKLIIKGLEASCRIGVLEAEQETPQPIWIDLELSIDAARAAQRDHVLDAVDYARVATEVKRLVEEKPYHLLETMAEEIASLLIDRFTIRGVVVRVTKRALPGIESAAVEVTRRVPLSAAKRP